MRFFVLAILLSVFLTACDSNRVYELNQEFKDRSWKTSDSTNFDFTIADAKSKYNVYCNVRNSLDYPWQRLFVQYTLRDSVGQIDGRLVSDYLFVNSGKPTGSSGLGDLYDHQFPILKNYEFKHAGKYTVRLQQFMRTDTLAGIYSVGVRVERAGK